MLTLLDAILVGYLNHPGWISGIFFAKDFSNLMYCYAEAWLKCKLEGCLSLVESLSVAPEISGVAYSQCNIF